MSTSNERASANRLGKDRGLGQYPPIEAHAIIGNARAIALVSCEGALDWLCLPRFDSPSVFGSLLHSNKGGAFRIRPTAGFQMTRAYAEDTNVLETSYATSSGKAMVTDLFAVEGELESKRNLAPEHEIIRCIDGREGVVEFEVLYEPRPDYGRAQPRLKDQRKLGVWCDTGEGSLVLTAEIPLRIALDRRSAVGIVRVRQGERVRFSLAYNGESPGVLPVGGGATDRRIDRSLAWWRAWTARGTYSGPHRAEVVRSALALKLMTYAPSGAVVAAPTTSLPEMIGGVRNWDYRYCWLRDAAMTVQALFQLGYNEEAVAFVGWVLHATRLTSPDLQVVYSVFGNARLPERELCHWEGYAGSRPVRVGNGAHSQFQLDVYGEVIAAVAQFAQRGGRLDQDTSRTLNGLGQRVCERWREPDDGIWEGRAGRFQHTHSKVLCWVALDRLVQMHEAGQVRVSVDLFRQERESIRTEVENRGYNAQLQSYTRLLDGDDVDASLLVLPLLGFTKPSDPRMAATVACVQGSLGRGNLVYRYPPATPDGFPPGEGAFGICGFWAVECRALAGDIGGATDAFEDLLSYANDVGLYAEEIDPLTRGGLGNMPQAFTHVGLINAAMALARGQGNVDMAATPETELSYEQRSLL